MVYNLASQGATNAATASMPSGGSSSSADWLNAGAQALRGGLEAMGQTRSSGSKEQRRRTRAEQLLNLLKQRLNSEDETRKTQNSMASAYNDLLHNKAAQFRQSLL